MSGSNRFKEVAVTAESFSIFSPAFAGAELELTCSELWNKAKG